MIAVKVTHQSSFSAKEVVMHTLEGRKSSPQSKWQQLFAKCIAGKVTGMCFALNSRLETDVVEMFDGWI